VKRKISLSVGVAAAWLLATTILTFAAPLLSITSPLHQDLLDILATPSTDRWFGTDSLGRDVFARSLFALRTTLIVGLASVVVGLAIGGTLGLLAGYFRGRAERVIMASNNVLQAFPPLVLVVALMAYPGHPLPKMILVLGLVFAGGFTRIARINTLRFAQQDFVTAARAIGMQNSRIIVREVGPNLIAPLLVYALMMIAVAAVAEGALSFLGLGVMPPTPTLGGMIAAEIGSLREAPHAVLFPAFVLFATIFALNRVGEHIQRSLEIKDSVL
jgi:peptide/nickel transport system permease protein